MAVFRRLDVAKSVTGSVIPPPASCGCSPNYLKLQGARIACNRSEGWHEICFTNRRALKLEVDVLYATNALPGNAAKPAPKASVDTTLLELVRTLGEVTSDESEIVATALHMLRSGSIQLTGSSQDAPRAGFID